MRHIPQGNTAEIGILSFADAMKPSGPVEYDREKWLYVPDRYSEYRYILGTRGSKPLICIGINPSTAAPDRLDNTLKSVERVALFNGFDSFLMLNVYAQRATDPNDMERDGNEELQRENLKAFDYVLSLCGDSPAVWAAWGAIIEKRPYLIKCAEELAAAGALRGAEWFTAGKRSKAGHPHHPLYLGAHSLLEKFDVDRYFREIART